MNPDQKIVTCECMKAADGRRKRRVMTPDHERVIRERLKSAAEGYPIHYECGGECRDFGDPVWLCNDCGERPMPEQVIMPGASDDYIEDVAALLAALDEARLLAEVERLSAEADSITLDDAGRVVSMRAGEMMLTQADPAKRPTLETCADGRQKTTIGYRVSGDDIALSWRLAWHGSPSHVESGDIVLLWRMVRGMWRAHELLTGEVKALSALVEHGGSICQIGRWALSVEMSP